jgi:3-methylfumaryl-CoA hydratase
MAIDIEPLRAWIGRQKTVSDALAPFPAAALTATLDRDDAPGSGEPLPPLWHWIYFHDPRRTSELAANGHATLGRFMPPVPLPRRMYAGGRITFQRPLLIGQQAKRISMIADLKARTGRSGELVFLQVRHEFTDADGTAIIDEQDLVYREPARAEGAAEARRSGRKAIWRREVETGEAFLFRYSALIFNAHRIHYDRPYCEEEGYPGLVVHGPLVATLLADLVRRHTDAAVTAFRFRAVRPLFSPSPCVVCGIPRGDTVELWAEDPEGALVMEAQASLGGVAAG